MFPPSARGIVTADNSTKALYKGVHDIMYAYTGTGAQHYGWNYRTNDGIALNNLFCYNDTYDPSCYCCGQDPYPPYNCYTCGTSTVIPNYYNVNGSNGFSISLTNGYYETNSGSANFRTGWKYVRVNNQDGNYVEAKCCTYGDCACGYGSSTSFYSASNPSNPGGTQTDLAGAIGIKYDGTLWAWGATGWMNYIGWQTAGTYVTDPVQLGANTWKGIAGPDLGENEYYYAFSVLGIMTNNTLWAWGRNNQGQLGVGDTTDRSSPTQVGTGTNWDVAAISDAGGSYKSTLAIKTDGTLWAWGNNTFGQLGQGNTINRSSPVQIGTGTTWEKISVSTAACAAIKTDGTLWTWGYGGDGRLGLSDSSSRSSPTQVGTGTNWSKIIVLYGGMAAIKTDGTLWVWGLTAQYGRGTNTTTNSPVQIGSSTDYADFVDARYWLPPFVISSDRRKIYTFDYASATRVSRAVLAGPYYEVGDKFQSGKANLPGNTAYGSILKTGSA